MIKKYSNYSEYNKEGNIGCGDVAYCEQEKMLVLNTNNIDGTTHKYIFSPAPQYIDITYNITTAGSTALFASNNQANFSKYFKMEVDESGEKINFALTYNFTTTGEHKVRLWVNEGIYYLSLAYMFNKIKTVKKADFSHIYSTVGNLNNCFSYSSIQEVNLTNLDTTGLVQMQHIFNTASSLTNVIGWDDVNWGIRNFTKTDQPKYAFAQAAYNMSADIPKKYGNIDAFNFNHYGIYKEIPNITIPANCENIEYAHCLYNIGSGTSHKTYTSLSPHFKTDKYGALYSTNGFRLVGIPTGMEVDDETYYIEEGVKELNELGFSRNKTINTLVIPNSLEITGYKDKHDGGIYSKMLNGGSNLHLFMYNQHTCPNVSVKEDNPRYKSIDGCIYSKDGKHLVFVPTSLVMPTDKKKVITIPEGVEYIDEEAFSLMTFQESSANYTKIVIPSTVKYIDDKKIHSYAFGVDYNSQLELINGLKQYAGVVLEVSADNPYYKVDATTNKIVKK